MIKIIDEIKWTERIVIINPDIFESFVEVVQNELSKGLFVFEILNEKGIRNPHIKLKINQEDETAVNELLKSVAATVSENHKEEEKKKREEEEEKISSSIHDASIIPSVVAGFKMFEVEGEDSDD